MSVDFFRAWDLALALALVLRGLCGYGMRQILGSVRISPSCKRVGFLAFFSLSSVHVIGCIPKVSTAQILFFLSAIRVFVVWVVTVGDDEGALAVTFVFMQLRE